MKTKNNHTVRVYKFNPQNLKQVIGVTPFLIDYAPTEKWHIYRVLVNGCFCGVEVNLPMMMIGGLGGRKESPRRKVGTSITNYLSGIRYSLPTCQTQYIPNKQTHKGIVEPSFKKLLSMGDFKKRDELTMLNLI